MNNLTIGLENVFASNGIAISIVGILIVFAALSIIAFSIAMLPKVLPLTEKFFPEEENPHAAPTVSKSSDHDQVLAAIAHALFHKHAESLPAK